MIHCPTCKATLSAIDIENGKCPQCGAELRKGVGPDGPDSSASDRGSATIEISQMPTIDSDSVELGDLKMGTVNANANVTVELDAVNPLDSDSIDDGPIPTPGGKGRATVEIDRSQQTVDSDVVDMAAFKDQLSSGNSDPNTTIEIDRMQRTVDSDSVELGNMIPPASNANVTVDVSALQQRLKDDAGPPQAAGEKTTIDLSRLSPAHDTDSVDIGTPQFPQNQLGATIDASMMAKTAQSLPSIESIPKQTDSSIAGGPISPSVDSVDVPGAQLENNKTVANNRLDVTIDSVEFVNPLDDASKTRATLPSVDLSPPRRTGTGTVQDRDLNKTVDSIDLSGPPKELGTVVDRNINATIDSIDLDRPPVKPGTIPDREAMKTYDSTDVSSREAKEVDQMWRGANVEKASPRMTIKGRESQKQTATASLVIQRRNFRETKTPELRLGGDADYDLIKMLGQGGMGVVYWARQASIDRNVAIKMLKPDMAKDNAQRNKFLAEAVITGDLDHPNIVPIYDLGKNPEGALFYAMKKVQGTPWDKAIARKSLSENLDILMKVADAVAFAHNRFVVHRDLKPENVMLGDFGEVLVMDWGLALPFGKFEKSRSIQPSVSMGGTPAYMAPEMATGPFDRIGPTSDVYLLGAILFEIVTGRPPHTGKDVMKCLFAAAKNDIQRTEKSGELMDIAYKAMSTKQAERYQTVQEFQQAIRDYEAHAASIAMTTRAGETLVSGEQTDNYQQFATAVFEYQEALKLWGENTRAEKGVPAAKLAYARSALRKGDLDLSESLLDLNEPSHGEYLLQVEAAKKEREAKQQRLKAARRAVRILGVSVFVAVTTGLIAVGYQTFQVSKQRDLALANQALAEKQEQLAKKNESEAIKNFDEANRQRTIAETNANEAKKQESIALANAEKAKTQEGLAKTNEAKAKENAKEADLQRSQAVANEKLARYEAYVALIGLAAAKIDENAFGYARDLLSQCQPELRNWEWGRLMHMCSQSVRDFDTGAPVDAIAFSPDGKRFATGGWNGTAQIWNVSDGSIVHSIPHGGLYVYAVAYSPDGKFLATGSSDHNGFLRIWNAETGELVSTLSGHQDGVVSVVYSHDGKRLLSTSFDNTARLWDVSTGRTIQKFVGHSWWVWDADFSPDEQQIVTASQDGTAMVWSTATGQHGPPFMGHQGPVYAVAFSSDGQKIATGGADRRVLIWRPSNVTAFDYRALVAGETPPPPTFQELAGHQAAVRSVAFTKDGKLLVSGGHDNTVRIWNPETGESVKTLRGHDSEVRATAFSPDGLWVVSASHDNHARLWNVEGYAESRVLQGKWLRGHDDAIMAVGFAPDGSRIITASRDRTARSWDSLTGKPLLSFEEGHAFLASTAVFSPDGKKLFTAAVDGTTRSWDLTTGVELIRLENSGRAAALGVSHNGRWLLTGGNQKDANNWKAQLWDAADGKLIRELIGHASEVTAIAFSPDDRICFTGDSNGRGVLWNTESGQEVKRLQWHTSKISGAYFLPNGSRLLTASDDKTVAQWNTSEMGTKPDSIAVDTRRTLKHEDSVLSLDVIADGSLAITCSNDGKVTLWNVDTGVAIRSLPLSNTKVNSAAISRDGKMAVTVHAEASERLVRLWDAGNGRELLALGDDGKPGPFLDMKTFGGVVWSAAFSPSGNAVVTIGGNEARLWDTREEAAKRRELMSFGPHAAVASVSYSPDGKRIVTGSWDNTARIWNAETGRAELKLIGGHQGYVNSALFSPDGRFVLTASDDRTAKLWDSQTGKVLQTYAGHGGPVYAASFSPNGEFVVTASEDKIARIWKTETGALVHELKGHAWGVLCAAFSADGKRVITGSDDNFAKVWDAATGQLLATLSGHTAAVTAVAFAPDGKRILTASEDFTAKLWDAENSKEILNLKGHTRELTSIAFSRDGRYALTGSRDGTAILWLTTDWKAEQAGQ